MRIKVTNLFFGTLFLILVVSLLGCDLNGVGEGKLVLQFPGRDRGTSLVWEPSVDMAIATYDIVGTGPRGDSFSVNGYTGTSFERSGLAAGPWTITLTGYNADGDSIATSIVEVSIRKSRETSATVTMRPLPGDGTLAITMQWVDSDSVMTSPRVFVTILDSAGTSTVAGPSELIVDGTSATGTMALAAGWYEVSVQLCESISEAVDEVVWQGVYVLRIVQGETTTGSVTVPEEEIRFGLGAVELLLEEDMDNPLGVSFTGLPETVQEGDSVTLQSAGTHSAGALYRWYVNGVLKGTGATFEHAFTETGTFAIALLVLDGGALGGYGESVTVTSAAVAIDKIPVFSTSSTVVPMSRSVIPSGMSLNDFYYAIFAPPITRFVESSESFAVGDSLEVDLFENSVTLGTSLTDEGYIKMSGGIVEKDTNGNDVETGKIEIVYDSANARFSYYSEILLSDPTGTIGWGTDGHLYVIHEIPFTQIEENNSFLAGFKMLAYLKQNPESLEVQLIESGELYSGPGEESDWIVGFAGTSFESLQNDDFPIAGIESDNRSSLVNDVGVPLADDFTTRRSAIVAAKDALFAADGTIGNPCVGYRNFSGTSQTTDIYVMMMPNDTSDGFLLKDFSSNSLSDSSGDPITFTPDDTDPTKVIMDAANVTKLISGLPSADWRTRTNLQ